MKFFRKVSAHVSGLKRLPKHVAVDIDNNIAWQKANKAPIKTVFQKRDEAIIRTIGLITRYEIPVLTLLLIPERRKDPLEFDSLVGFFKNKALTALFKQKQVKVSVLGKWYDLPGHLVEAIKYMIDETKEFDRFFVNFCINYNGQDEIVDACRLIAMRIKAGKLDPQEINKETIKDNLYSSYFLPPDLMIKTGKKQLWSDLLLWDCPGAVYSFTDCYYLDMSDSDFVSVLADFSSL